MELVDGDLRETGGRSELAKPWSRRWLGTDTVQEK
jgi:hypothetical protein